MLVLFSPSWYLKLYAEIQVLFSFLLIIKASSTATIFLFWYLLLLLLLISNNLCTFDLLFNETYLQVVYIFLKKVFTNIFHQFSNVNNCKMHYQFNYEYFVGKILIINVIHNLGLNLILLTFPDWRVFWVLYEIFIRAMHIIT